MIKPIPLDFSLGRPCKDALGRLRRMYITEVLKGAK